MVLTDSERNIILNEWNDTAADFPDGSCLHHLFEEHARQYPDRPGVIYRGEAISYGELESRSNILAAYLVKQGAGIEDLVGICLERSIEMVVAILGVLKAGCAYVPVDPAYPQDRIDFMLRDTHVSLLLTQEHLLERFPDLDTRNLALDLQWPEIERESDTTLLPVEVTPENLCYVIYTSGSTGTPKGIVLRHRGVVNNIFDLNDSFGVSSDARIPAISALGFDMCVYEVLGTLAAGGAIVMPEQSLLKDPSHWAELIKAHNVTVWNSAPALLEMLVDYVEARPQLQPLPIRLVIQGGDWEPLSLPDRLRAIAPEAQVVVLGGATEASIHSIVFLVDKVDPGWKSIPYGKPMRNQTAYILDEDLEPVAVGEPGELHLGGIGLARGYFERPELTREKFIPHPFSDDPGERIYKTGDLTRWMPDGNIELLGRMDFQVKIRGHRIELGEIIECLRKHEDVEDALVVMREDKAGHKRLAAYVIPSRDQHIVEKDSGTESQVDQWKEIYDHTYNGESHPDSELNFIGWNSSYTGKPFSDEEMNEMLDHSVRRILAVSPDRALEIGCGTGLILLKVAPFCSEYQAADLSAVAIDSLQRKIERNSALAGKVSLDQGAADNFSNIKPGYFDTAIINSVIQHFPDVDYLTRVLEKTINALATKGTVFVGDVRNLALLDLFHTSIETLTADDQVATSELLQRIQRRSRNEKELAVAPEYFLSLVDRIDSVSHVAVVLKRGKHANEFNKFHYDVYIHLGEALPEIADCSQLTWGQEVKSLDDLSASLANATAPVIRLNKIPNERLVQDLELQGALVSRKHETASQVRSASASGVTAGLDPDLVWEMEENSDYACEICLSCGDPKGSYDAVFVRKDMLGELPLNNAIAGTAIAVLDPGVKYANKPFREKSAKKLVPELRRLISTKLPDYMEPQDFVVLEKFPLTPNGKVDRNALPVPNQTRPDLEENYVPPDSAMEQALCLIWEEVLELDAIGIEDGFLSLGGHSLKATQIVSRVNEVFDFRIGMQDIFDHKNIRNLASHMLAPERESSLLETAENYVRFSNLSTAELQSLLEEETSE